MRRGRALKRIRQMTGHRSVRLEHEKISPAEDVFLSNYMKFEEEYSASDIHIDGLLSCGISDNKKKRLGIDLYNYKIIAKALGLWPIPDWWKVKYKLTRGER